MPFVKNFQEKSPLDSSIRQFNKELSQIIIDFMVENQNNKLFLEIIENKMD
jgi:hypothetical protein